MRQLTSRLRRVNPQLAGHAGHRVTAQNTGNLVGRNRQVLAFANPGRHHIPQPRLVELLHQTTQTALPTVGRQQAAQHIGQTTLLLQLTAHGTQH